MRAAADLRLPGVYFLPAPRPPGLGLPPLDVAAFVGFAARGPLDQPVAIEDLNAYGAIFGGDLPLARDERGQTMYAHLRAAVATFFVNGGRRCYVVRVAGPGASRARFRVPGMVALGGSAGPQLAGINASWEGRWASEVRLGARLQSTPLPPSRFQVLDSQRLEWQTDSAPQAIRQGDVLRLTGADGRQWLFPVLGIERPAITGPSQALHPGQTTSPPGSPGVRRDALPQARLITQRAWPLLSLAPLSPPPVVQRVSRLTLDGTEDLDVSAALVAADQGITLALTGGDAAQIERGDVLQLELGSGAVWLAPVAATRLQPGASSPPEPRVAVTASMLLDISPGSAFELPASPFGALRRVERLRLDLPLREGPERRSALADLAFNAGHPRFWGEVALLDSSPLLRRSSASAADSHYPVPTQLRVPGSSQHQEGDDQGATPAAQAARLYREMRQERRSEETQNGHMDQTTLAGLLAPLEEHEAALTYLPLGMPSIVADDDMAGPTMPGTDDLETFDDFARLFLDDYLVPFPRNQSLPPGALMSEALDRYYVQDRRLRGLHSLLFVDEVAMVSVPEAVHLAWQPAAARPALPPLAAPPVSQPAPCPPGGSPFVGCELPPVVLGVEPHGGLLDGGNLIAVTGTGFAAPGEVEIRVGGRLATEVTVDSDTTLTCVTPPGSSPGPVEVEVHTRYGTGARAGAFIYHQQSSAASLPETQEAKDFELAASPLLAIQQAMVYFCQARRDVLGILTLPAHFEKRQCIEWQQQLRQLVGLPTRRSVFNEAGGGIDLSYVAVYHPWLLLPDAQSSGGLRAVPCEGAVCGMIAAREHVRQVWVAPANMPLSGVLSLAPPFSSDDWAELFDLQFNLVRPEPRDFRVMSAHTLSDERSLLQVSVRRLMILLRKTVAQRGMDFVFESNHERFRESVRVVLEDLLRYMYERGAFSGATPEQAFRVVTDASVNPPQSVDQGRFIAEVRVAPSQPMEFITVVLTRTDEGLLRAREA